jgi:hypothetical protein
MRLYKWVNIAWAVLIEFGFAVFLLGFSFLLGVVVLKIF